MSAAAVFVRFAGVDPNISDRSGPSVRNSLDAKNKNATPTHLTTAVLSLLLQVSSSFAEASGRKMDGETAFGEQVGSLQAQLREANNQALESQVSKIFRISSLNVSCMLCSTTL